MRILIAANQAKVRFALRVALERRPGIKTIVEAVDAEALATQTGVSHPDIALVDWELSGMPMAELLDSLHRACANLRIIVLNSREETRQQAVIAGADAFVCMCNAPDELLTAIDDFKIEPIETEEHKQS